MQEILKEKDIYLDDYGEKWFADETSFEKDLEEVWGGRWGLCSEVGKLKAVALRRPGKEIESVVNPADWRWGDVMDPDLARLQHDALTKIYKDMGAKIIYVEDTRSDRPNAVFSRDNVLGTPEGVIICRQALRLRRGEEASMAMSVARAGCPIVRTISGTGVFEGACAMWVNRETIILGTGVRANEEGVRQVEEVLRPMGVRNFIRFQIPYGHAHIDGLMNFVDRDKVLVFPWQTPYDVVKTLSDMGIKIIEAPSIQEAKYQSAMNLVGLEPGRVLMASGNPITKKELERHGIEVVEIDVSELRKGLGSVHCMTGALARDEDW